MEIVETSGFTRRIKELLSDDEYRLLQQFLVDNPDSGSVIPHSGGFRKIRWGLHGRGKRGGVRVIYYSQVDDWLYMILVYAKNEQDNLTPEQLRQLRTLSLED